MKQTTRNFFKNETFVATLLILLTTVITYGLSIPKLGYYHDDWFVLGSGAGCAEPHPIVFNGLPIHGCYLFLPLSLFR